MDFNIAQHNPKTSVLFNRVKVRWILQIKAVGKMLFGREKQENEERRLLGVTPCLWRRNLHCFIGLHRVLPSWFVWEHWDTLMAWHGNAHPAPEGIQESARGGKSPEVGVKQNSLQADPHLPGLAEERGYNFPWVYKVLPLM